MDITEKAIEYIKALFAGVGASHDAEHTMRVYRNAMMIAKGAGAGFEASRQEAGPQGESSGPDMQIVALAALLHDADDYKLFSTEDNANARAFLKAQGVDPARTELICEAINSVSFSKNRGRRPRTLEGQIVQDADRLDAIGAVGIARTFTFGGEHGRSLAESIDHFHEKLLLLAGEMNTPAAKELAQERHRFMEEFLKEFDKETKEPDF